MTLLSSFPCWGDSPVAIDTVVPSPLPQGASATVESWQGSVARISATLMLLVTLIVIGGWMLRRLMQARMQQVNQNHLIKILSQRPLSPKTNLYMVQVGDKSLLLAESVNGIYSLSEIVMEQGHSDAIDSPQIQRKSFRAILDKVLPTNRQ